MCCEVKRRRIRIALFAFAYELIGEALIKDEEYDRLAREVDYTSPTDNPTLDKFYLNEYTPDSGMWVRKHPELDKLECLYKRIALSFS